MTNETLNKALLLRHDIKEIESMLDTIKTFSEHTNISIKYTDENNVDRSFMIACLDKKILRIVKLIYSRKLIELYKQFQKL